MNKSIIIPVASGKGGVGKSIITANLALALSNTGHSVIAIDLDLGGSNLYSYLGMENKYPGIGDYLYSKKGTLTDYIIDTPYPNLRYLAGERRVTFMANLQHGHKVKLIKEINALEADYVLLDLGAGTTFNTLDFFELSKQGIVVTSFDKPSVINTLSFLKNFIYRIIFKEAKKNHYLSKIVNDTYKNLSGDELLLVSKILSIIETENSEMASIIKSKCTDYHPIIIFNKGDHPDQIEISEQIENTVRKVLSIDLSFLGFIFYDDSVKQSTINNTVLLNEYPDCIASKEIKKIADRIVKFNQKYIGNSAELLYKSTLKKYEIQSS